MSVPPNPLLPALDELLSRLAFLSSLLSLLATRVASWEKFVRKQLEEKKHPIDALAHGIRLVLTDLTGPTQNGWLVHFATTGILLEGEKYLKAGDALVRRESAWTAAQANEAFETFLFDSAAIFLRERPAHADASARRKFEAALSKKDGEAPSPANNDYWLRLVRSSYRGSNNDRLFRLLRKVAPTFGQAEIDNTRVLNLRAWYKAACEARHATVHANCMVKQRKAFSEKYSKWFPIERRVQTLVLAMTPKNTDACLEIYGEYAFQVFKHLSLVASYDWESAMKPTAIRRSLGDD